MGRLPSGGVELANAAGVSMPDGATAECVLAANALATSARIDIEDRPCVFCLVRGPCTIVISEIARRDQPCEEKAARPPDTLHGHTAFRDLHTKWLSGRGSMGESVRTPEGECENV